MSNTGESPFPRLPGPRRISGNRPSIRRFGPPSRTFGPLFGSDLKTVGVCVAWASRPCTRHVEHGRVSVSTVARPAPHIRQQAEHPALRAAFENLRALVRFGFEDGWRVRG